MHWHSMQFLHYQNVVMVTGELDVTTAALKDAHPHVANSLVSVTAVNQGSMVTTVMSPALKIVISRGVFSQEENVQLVNQDTMMNIVQSNVDIVKVKDASSHMALVQSVILDIMDLSVFSLVLIIVCINHVSKRWVTVIMDANLGIFCLTAMALVLQLVIMVPVIL